METITRIIVDTNWYISASINKKSRKTLYSILIDKRFEVYYCDALIREYKTVIGRSKFRKYISLPQVNRFIRIILPILKSVEIHSSVNLCRDKKDNFLLALSAESDADYIISGDPDLLVIQKYKQTKIITMKKFLSIFF